jgi:hypothetical protein
MTLIDIKTSVKHQIEFFFTAPSTPEADAKLSDYGGFLFSTLYLIQTDINQCLNIDSRTETVNPNRPTIWPALLCTMAAFDLFGKLYNTAGRKIGIGIRFRKFIEHMLLQDHDYLEWVVKHPKGTSMYFDAADAAEYTWQLRNSLAHSYNLTDPKNELHFVLKQAGPFFLMRKTEKVIQFNTGHLNLLLRNATKNFKLLLEDPANEKLRSNFKNLFPKYCTVLSLDSHDYQTSLISKNADIFEETAFTPTDSGFSDTSNNPFYNSGLDA